jgi:hypothetical protein
MDLDVIEMVNLVFILPIAILAIWRGTPDPEGTNLRSKI